MLVRPSLVRSFTQPGRLTDKIELANRFPPRGHATERWRAGPDMITDGDKRRGSFSSRLAPAPERISEPRPMLRIKCKIRRKHVRAAEPLVIAPDCGIDYMSRDVAFIKMKAMASGAAIVPAELS